MDYKPNTGWRISERGDCVFVQHTQQIPCTQSGEVSWQRGRKWYISDHATELEIVRTLRAAVLAFEEHEINETLLYRGERVLNPHPEGGRQ